MKLPEEWRLLLRVLSGFAFVIGLIAGLYLFALEFGIRNENDGLTPYRWIALIAAAAGGIGLLAFAKWPPPPPALPKASVVDRDRD